MMIFGRVGASLICRALSIAVASAMTLAVFICGCTAQQARQLPVGFIHKADYQIDKGTILLRSDDGKSWTTQFRLQYLARHPSAAPR